MKIMKYICSILCAMALFCSCGGATSTVEGINGRVTLDGYEGRYVYLKTTDTNPTLVDSASVSEGRFTFTLHDEQPKVYTLVLKASDDDQYPITLPVVSEKGHIKVSMGELVLTSGPPLNDTLQDFLLAVSNFMDKSTSQEKLDLNQIKEDFSKIVEGAVMQNINTPVGSYIYRMYSDRLNDTQKEQIMTRADESFKEAVKY